MTTAGRRCRIGDAPLQFCAMYALSMGPRVIMYNTRFGVLQSASRGDERFYCEGLWPVYASKKSTAKAFAIQYIVLEMHFLRND